MRKDYRPVTVSEAGLPELDLVESQWTGIWDSAKPEWDRSIRGLAQREEYRLMGPYLEQMKGTGIPKLLDAGCGLGEWTIFLGRLGCEVHGIDISSKTIGLLRQRFPEQRFECGDIRATPYAEQSFDGLFSWGVFEHFEEGLGRCLAEAFRVLKLGGYLFITVPFHNRRLMRFDRKSLPVADKSYSRGKRYPLPLRFYQWRLTAAELEREVAMAGFEVMELKAIHKEHGSSRLLAQYGIDYGRLNLAAARVVYHFLPAGYVAHMIMAIGRKPS